MNFSAQAELPAPDNILYGTVSIGSTPITATNTDYVIEARRSQNGPAIARYRMGSDPSAGGLYVLKITLEELVPTTDATHSLVGDDLVLIVRNNSGIVAQQNYRILERGVATRLDFGTTNPDSDNDGLPDAWEFANFNTLNPNPNGDPDGDGVNNRNEYLAGTDPNDPRRYFQLTIDRVGPASRVVKFFAISAAGIGYEGFNRFYSLESTTNLANGPWRGVPNYTNLLGNNRDVLYPSNEPDVHTYYRCRLTLQR